MNKQRQEPDFDVYFDLPERTASATELAQVDAHAYLEEEFGLRPTLVGNHFGGSDYDTWFD